MKFIDQNIYFPACVHPPGQQCAELGKSTKDKETSFLFVNSKEGQTPKQSRQSLRSHVMQQARSRRKWSTSKGAINSDTEPPSRRSSASKSASVSRSLSRLSIVATPSTDGSGTTSPDETPTDGPCITTESSQSPISQAPMPTTSSVHFETQQAQIMDNDYFGKDWYFLDPYANLPVKLDAISRGMLDHYLATLNECFTLSGRMQASISHTWFVAAFASRAFMYSLLCAAATHLYALGRISHYSILEHKSNTINELSTTLSDPVLGVNDGNIGAVFNLMCVDEALPVALDPQFPNYAPGGFCYKKSRVHSKGLNQMIRVRGGLLNLRHNPCLFSFLLWHAAAHSVASFQPSAFFPCAQELIQVLDQLSQASRSDPSKRLARLLLSSGAPHRLVIAARHVVASTRQFMAWLAGDPKAPSYTQNGDFSGLLQMSLLHFLNSQIEFDPMSEAIATAMIMFTVRKSNDATTACDTLHFAATRWLRHGLRHAPDADWDPDIRLWTTTVGAVCAQESAEQIEIENAFVWACQAWDLRTCEQLLDALRSVCWIEERFDAATVKLWVRLKDRILGR